MSFKHLALLPLQVFICITLNAQDKSPVKYGKISPDDFSTKNLHVDTADGAVVIADIGSSTFEGNSKGWFSLIHTHYRRVLVTNRNGINLADVQIPLYLSSKSDGEEKLEKLKACTYNLENGKVVETKLSDDAIYKEKVDKNHLIKKFSMPAVKAGSIIEYSYTINSDFLFNLQPWNFQGSYPRVWSEYSVQIPAYFEYVFLAQGYQKFDINTRTSDFNSYQVRVPTTNAFEKDELLTVNAPININRWVMKDVPSLKEENFISSIDNFTSKVEFQMSGIQFPNQQRKDIMGNWPKLKQELLEEENFGAGLRKPNNWLDDDLAVITRGSTGELDKAMKIYKYVQTTMKSQGKHGIYLSKTPKEVFHAKSGYDQEINILLTTMLRHEKLEASPVLLSTVKNGYTNETYPLVDKFNYVICMVKINGANYLLDASQTYLGFGKLPGYTYNGHARVLNEMAEPIYISPDTLHESKVTIVNLSAEAGKGGEWNGSYSDQFGYMESSNIRSFIQENGKQAFEKKVKASFTGDYSVDKLEIEDLENNDNSIKLSEDFKIAGQPNASTIYFNPMLNSGYKENPFKSSTRKYPVEMPYSMDETFIMRLEIPAGYVVDEMPKSERITFNNNEGMFEYLFSKSENDISFRSRLKFDKATFNPEDYEGLRQFYDHIVKKHAEQIVFKKKS